MDSESPEVFEEKIITARKEHQCCECHSIIEPDDEYHFARGCWNGSWVTFRTCIICNNLRHKLSNSEYGIPPFGLLCDWADDAGIPM